MKNRTTADAVSLLLQAVAIMTEKIDTIEKEIELLKEANEKHI